MSLPGFPTRLVTRAYILHTGLDKTRKPPGRYMEWHPVHTPVFKELSPERFPKLLAAGEIAAGAALLSQWFRPPSPEPRERSFPARSSAFTGDPQGCTKTASGRPRKESA